MSDQTKCSRCGDWIDGNFGVYDHDFQHLDERKVEALERIADALQRQSVTYTLEVPTLDVQNHRGDPA